MGQTALLSYDRIMETAASCRTWRQFYRKYPNVYDAARTKGWLAAAQSHCGLELQGRTVRDRRPAESTNLKEILEGDASLLLHAMDDPKWPMDVVETPLDEELI